ncbi:hypothetical protein ABPG72_012126 [Tetrahymena utriculariae]
MSSLELQNTQNVLQTTQNVYEQLGHLEPIINSFKAKIYIQKLVQKQVPQQSYVLRVNWSCLKSAGFEYNIANSYQIFNNNMPSLELRNTQNVLQTTQNVCEQLGHFEPIINSFKPKNIFRNWYKNKSLNNNIHSEQSIKQQSISSEQFPKQNQKQTTPPKQSKDIQLTDSINEIVEENNKQNPNDQPRQIQKQEYIALPEFEFLQICQFKSFMQALKLQKVKKMLENLHKLERDQHDAGGVVHEEFDSYFNKLSLLSKKIQLTVIHLAILALKDFLNDCLTLYLLRNTGLLSYNYKRVQNGEMVNLSQQ